MLQSEVLGAVRDMTTYHVLRVSFEVVSLVDIGLRQLQDRLKVALDATWSKLSPCEEWLSPHHLTLT